jgi:hypothetical protein
LQAGEAATYRIFISRDGRNYDLLQDHSRQQMTGWQEFQFPARPVKCIKIVSTGPNARLSVDCLEAYCYMADAESNAHSRSARGAKGN